MVNKPWFIDALTYVVVFAWMGWTFTTIQQQGATPLLLVSAVVVLAAGLLLIYNQRLAYLRVGDRIVLETREGRRGRQAEEPRRRETETRRED